MCLVVSFFCDSFSIQKHIYIPLPEELISIQRLLFERSMYTSISQSLFPYIFIHSEKQDESWFEQVLREVVHWMADPW